jgi:NADH-quinone oxidoreductase subunit J
MSILQIIFYLYSATAVFSALMVVGSSNPVRGTLFLVLTFFSMAGLWMLLHAEFLALVLVLVYVGAVMTLFLFVVMMLSIDRIGAREGFVRYLPLVALMVILTVGLMIMAIGPHRFGIQQIPLPPLQPANYSNTASLGMVVYTDYAFPFEVAAVLLLTAIVAAITLTHRAPKPHKSQKVSAQIAVNPKDRIRLVNMPSTPKIITTAEE